MEPKIFKRWGISTRRTLDTIWKFRKLCGRPFDRGFIGELLVLEQLLKTYKSKLCASTNNGFVYEGSSNKKWDISLTLDEKTVYINAKATSTKDKKGKNGKPRWVRQQARLFCDVEIDKRTSIQKVGKKRKEDINLFYVFVDVGSWVENGDAKVKFFTLSHKKAASIFRKKYFKGQNNKERKSKSTDFWVEYKDIEGFNDDELRRIFK